MFASYREAFRAPAESQLFRQGAAESTVDLKPVRAQSWEAGARTAIGGSATFEAYGASPNKRQLQVDFAARTVSGSVDLNVYGERSYQFADVSLSADGTQLTGRLVPGDGTPEGRVDGIFMGPGGTEMALRASFPTHPQLVYPYLFLAKRIP